MTKQPERTEIQQMGRSLCRVLFIRGYSLAVYRADRMKGALVHGERVWPEGEVYWPMPGSQYGKWYSVYPSPLYRFGVGERDMPRTNYLKFGKAKP